MAFLSFFTIALGVPLRSVTPIAIIALAFWFLPTLVPAIVVAQLDVSRAAVVPARSQRCRRGRRGVVAARTRSRSPSIVLAAAVFVAAVALFERQEL